MSFAGSVQDMINRIKDNRDLVQVRKDRTAKIRDLYVRSGHTQVRHEHEHLPVKEKEQIRDRIKNEYRRIFWEKVSLLIISIAISVIPFYLIVSNISNHHF